MSTNERTGERDGEGTDPSVPARYRLERLRTEPLALALATVVGLLLAWIHWLGIVAGGALVGVVSPTPRHGVLAAVGFGIVVLLVFAATLGESAVAVSGMTPAVYVTIGGAIGLALLGSLVRGIV